VQGEWDEASQIRARAVHGAVQVLLADGDHVAHRWLRMIVGGYFDLEAVDSGEQALDRIAAGKARLVIIGNALEDMTGAQLLERAAQWLVAERRAPMTFLLASAEGESPDVDPRQVKVFYRLVRSMSAERVRSLLQQAAAELPSGPPKEVDPALAKLVGSHVAKINAASEPDAVAREVKVAITSLVGADRARCIYCDEESGDLWSGTVVHSEEDDPLEPAMPPGLGGIAGFASRSVSAIALPRAGGDPLYDPRVDDPEGTGRERIALQPVVGPDGHVHAVLVAVRAEDRPPFTSEDLDKLEALALAWSPSLMALSMRLEADQILGDKLDDAPQEIFRQEAIDNLVRRGARGDVVRVHPGWVRAAYWLVVLALAGGAAFSALARIHQYAEGPAVVRFIGRSEVVAFETGTIASLEVKRGQSVKAGEPLARLHDTEQAARLRGLENEFERNLVGYLQTPADPSVKAALAAVVSQRESARAGVESRVIRAPHDGVIKEVLARNGERVEAGKAILTIVENPSLEGLSVLAFLPGSERPRLRAHQKLRLTIPGYRGATIGGEVRAISNEVLGANEARARYLGERLGESLPIKGSVVVVEALLKSPEFEADGQRFQLHDGMIGIAEIKLQSRTVLETLVPGLRR
jgi:multidrug efflux pump subunit AcrA (membrane-fusion protein)/CheY-like chemotaxis protein